MAQRVMGGGFQAYEDDVEDRDDFHWLREKAKEWLKIRGNTIKMLKRIGEEADAIHKECSEGIRNGNFAGVLGGGCGVLAGGLTIFTGGLAAPLVLAGLTCAGGVCSVGGGGWAIKNELNRGQRMSKLHEKILQQIEEDNVAVQEMNEIFHLINNGDFGKPDRIFRELHMVCSGVGSIGMILGSTAAIDALSQFVLLPVSCYLTPETHKILSSIVKVLSFIAEKGVFKGAEEVAEQCASSAVKNMYDGFSKNFVRQKVLKAAGKAYKEVFEEAMEKAAEKAVKEAAKKGGDLAAQNAAREAGKEAFAKAAKETATKAAQKAATTTAKEGMKTAAKFTGAVAASFGAFTLLWEGYNAYRNHQASQEKSELGEELRALADEMEMRLEIAEIID